MDQSHKIGQSYYPKHPVSPIKNNNSLNTKTEFNPFNKVLAEKLNSEKDQVKFSTHAMQRLDKRGIHLDKNDIHLLNDAVSKAAEKGSKDSLILMKDLAFVVNVTNRVVVTTVDEASMKDHIFTNIDSAVIV